MKQYNAIKVKYPDALLLFRVGDFYETFGSDAVKASKILDIILTKRGALILARSYPFGNVRHPLPKFVCNFCSARPLFGYFRGLI